MTFLLVSLLGIFIVLVVAVWLIIRYLGMAILKVIAQCVPGAALTGLSGGATAGVAVAIGATVVVGATIIGGTIGVMDTIKEDTTTATTTRSTTITTILLDEKG